MGSFQVSYRIVKKHEGGFLSAKMAAKAGDAGGMTYKGVARNFNPNWAGWKIIDAYIAKNGEPKWNTVINDPVLDGLVLKLFKEKYWDIFGLDKLKNQSLCNLIFDYSINGGQGATKHALEKATGVTKNFIDEINKSIRKKEIFETIQENRIADINKKKDSFDPQLIQRTNSFFFLEETSA